VQLQFRLSASLRERLRKEAQRRNVSANLLIERALEEGLTKWEKEKKP
jgi:predicted HicB family RNase H-like nuclease